MQRFMAFAAASLVLTAVGCGGDGKVTISGQVTFNGRPVEQGSIQFHATDGSGIDGGTIANGRYELRTRPGAKKVAIIGERVVGQTRHDVGVRVDVFDDKANYIPPEFNDATTLTHSVQGNETKDFALIGNDLLDKKQKGK